MIGQDPLNQNLSKFQKFMNFADQILMTTALNIPVIALLLFSIDDVFYIRFYARDSYTVKRLVDVSTLKSSRAVMIIRWDSGLYAWLNRS